MLTREEKASVWARKDELTAELSFVEDGDKAKTAEVLAGIEFCNKQLIQDKLDPVEPKE